MDMETRIKELRIDNSLTQTQLAAAIGITQRKYSYIETGVQPLTDDLICRLARYYNTTSDYILRLSDKQQ